MPSLVELAQILGVHKSTVSRALRNHPSISPARRAAIQAAAAQAGYQRDPLAAALSSRRRKSSQRAQTTIAVVVHPNQRYETFRLTLDGLRTRAAELGFTPEVFYCANPDDAHRLLATLWNRGVRGLILLLDVLFLFPDDTDWKPFTVLVVRCRHDDHPFDTVRDDTFAKLTLIFNRLRSRHYRRIGAVIWSEPGSVIDQRSLGAVLAFQDKWIAPPDRVPPLLFRSDLIAPEMVWRAGAMQPGPLTSAWFLEHKPDAVVGFGLVYWWLRAMNLRMPEDVGFVSYEPLADEEFHRIGRLAVDQLDLLLRLNQTGIPTSRALTLVDPVWSDQPTIRPQEAGFSQEGGFSNPP